MEVSTRAEAMEKRKRKTTYLLVVGAHGSVEGHGLGGRVPLVGVDQVAADHEARATLAGFTVHHGEVVLVLVQELFLSTHR